jgi:hypothetical protein
MSGPTFQNIGILKLCFLLSTGSNALQLKTTANFKSGCQGLSNDTCFASSLCLFVQIGISENPKKSLKIFFLLTSINDNFLYKSYH